MKKWEQELRNSLGILGHGDLEFCTSQVRPFIEALPKETQTQLPMNPQARDVQLPREEHLYRHNIEAYSWHSNLTCDHVV